MKSRTVTAYPPVHKHPLSVESICCPDHVYEICSVFQKQGREDEVVFALLSLTDLLDTPFLLDASEQAQIRKKALIGMTNEFALYCGNAETLDIATSLLGIAETLLGAVRLDEDVEGLRTTTLLNIGFICLKEGNPRKALEALEEACKLEQQRKDPVGLATVKISMSSLYIHLENFEEAHQHAQQAFRILEEQQKSRDSVSQRLKGLILAAKLNITSASDHLYEGKGGSQLFELKSSLIEFVEGRVQGQEASVKIKEYDGSPIHPIQRNTHRQATTGSNLAEDFRSFCERVQGWEKDKVIDNPSFITIREHGMTVDTPKTPSRLSLPSARETRKIFTEASLHSQQPMHEDLQSPEIRVPNGIEKPAPKVQLRVPGSPLPQIPARSMVFMHSHISIFKASKALPDYKEVLVRLLPAKAESICIKKPIGNEAYTILCSVSKSHISISASNEKGGDSPPDELLSLEEFLMVLDYLNIQETFPKNLTSNLLVSIEDCIRICMLPFLQITTGGQKASQRIELWNYAPGLLPHRTTRRFLGQLKRVSVHQIGPMTLRVVLSEIASAPNPENDLYIEVLIDENAKSSPGFVWENGDSLKAVTPSFLETMNPVLIAIEKELKTRAKFLLIRVLFSGEANLMVVIYVLDDIRNRNWTCSVQKMDGSIPDLVSFPYLMIVSSFGLLPKHIPSEETLLLASLLSDSLVLEVVQQDEITETLVNLASMESIAFYRTILPHRDTFVPVTLSLIGMKQRLIGVRATAWNVKTALESGCLWYLDSGYYRIQEDSGTISPGKKKKNDKKEGLIQTAEKETSILMFLQQDGWKKLLKVLTLGSGEEPDLAFADSKGKKRHIDRLEPYLLPN